MPLLRSLLLVALTASALAAAPWKLVLKDGRTLVCDAPPIVIDGSYMFRDMEGKDGSIEAAQVDPEKTAHANGTDFEPRWRMTGHTEQRIHPDQPEFTGSGRVLLFGASNFSAEVLHSPVPVLVDFRTDWCGYCRKIAPTVDALANQYADRIKVGKIDGDRNAATADRYGVDGYPTLLLFKNGAVVGKIVGLAGRDEIARMIDAHL